MEDEGRILRAQEIFLSLIDTPRDEIERYLKIQCGDDLVLTDYCWHLILNNIRDTSTVELLYGKEKIAPIESGKVGDTLGSYYIREKIGQGGMAEVYLANRSDGVHGADVALKIIHCTGNQDRLITRFHSERNILANLKHPNIAQLLDGGTTEQGLPYFVMEYIAGEPIDKYCRSHQLSFDEILAIFIKVCTAIEFAHQNLVIHRDIKPANIVVNAKGEPMLLDFGIAKVLQPTPPDNDTSTMLALTTDYASPEQILGANLTTATDVYSLGILLYELLCGVRPPRPQFRVSNSALNSVDSGDNLAPSKFLEIILKDGIPSRLDTNTLHEHRRKLKGDIDSILVKALENSPENRFVSVQDFSRDIDRHLRNLPVSANNNTFIYRTSRFIRRNRLTILLSVIASTLFFSGIGIQQYRVVSERDIAIQQRDKQQITKDFLLSLFESSHPEEFTGEQLTAKDIIDRGLAKIEHEFDSEPALKAEIMTTMGVVYRELNATDVASTLLNDALELRRTLFPEISKEVGESLLELGILEYRRSNAKDAQIYLEQSILIYQALDVEYTEKLADGYHLLGYSLSILGQTEDALTSFETAKVIRIEYFGSQHSKIADSISAIGSVFRKNQDYQRSLDFQLEAFEIRQKSLPPSHPHLARSYHSVGLDYFSLGDLVKARDYLEKGLDIWKNVHGDGHELLGEFYFPLSHIDYYNGKYEEALDKLSIARELNLKNDGTEGVKINSLTGLIYEATGDLEQGLVYKEKALELSLEYYGSIHAQTAREYNNVAIIYSKLGRYDDAISSLTEAISVNINLFGELNPRVANNYDSFGEIYLDKGDFELALQYYAKARADFTALFGEDHPGVKTADKGIAKAREQLDI